MNLSTLQLNHSVGRRLAGARRGASRRTRCSRRRKIFFGGARKSRNAEHILLTTHLAESREEMEMFRDASGPLYEFHQKHRATDG